MPEAILVAIGDEILAGRTINSNAAFLSRELTRLGINVIEHHVFPDEKEILEIKLKNLLERNAFLIITGGLGPTLDDHTREVAAKLHGCDLSYSKEVAEVLCQRYGDKLPTIEDQATIPSKATPLHNPVGTAPGLLFENAVFLPGVPSEMEAIVKEHLTPYLKRKFPETAARETRSLLFCLTGEHMVDPYLRSLQESHPECRFGIYPSPALVQVVIEGEAVQEKLLKVLEAAFPKENTLPIVPPVEEALHKKLIEKKLSLSCAESLTGGMLASRLTALPGASAYFYGSAVTYSDSAKINLLNVPKKTLKEKGAVSEEVARAMATGCNDRFQTDYSLALTGIAGPSGATPTKPVGTVHLAIGHKDQVIHHEQLSLRGPREVIVQACANIAFFRLYSLLP